MKPRYKIGEVLNYKGWHVNIIISKKYHACIALKTGEQYYCSDKTHNTCCNSFHLSELSVTNKVTFDKGS